MNAAGITLGDPVPWFRGRNVVGQPFDLHVAAGRWVVLAFFGPIEDPETLRRLAALAEQTRAFSEDHLSVYVFLPGPVEDLAKLLPFSGQALRFIADYDGAIGKYFHADEKRRTIVLDPMLRAVADITWDIPNHEAMLRGLLAELPKVDDMAGVPLTAPALIVPRVFDFPLCDMLVGLYDKVGGSDSGFLVDRAGKTETVVDYKTKRRNDLVIALPEVREMIRHRIVTRLVPAIELYFQFKVTRMDRQMVSCYDAAIGGHFSRHRDNLNAGAEHRRFAVSINLNSNYEGCDLIFPEFGRRTYRAPAGGAIVFSCGALHEVTPITRGKRYAFIPFLYGEEDAKRRLANNARLHAGETQYEEGSDMLFPDAAKG